MHDQEEIMRCNAGGPDEEMVVRWCKICGGVVVDLDYDNRTKSGYFMKMKFPKMAMLK